MTQTSWVLRTLSMLAGGALVACQIKLNLEAVGTDFASGIALSAMALPVAMVLAVAVLEHRIGARQYGAAALAGVVLLAGIAHTLVVALERGVHAREQIAATRSAPNAARELAEKAHAAAIVRVRELEAAEAKPCRITTRSGEPTRECQAARAQTVLARQTVENEQRKLEAVAPAIKLDGMHARYGTLAVLIDDWHPVMLPLSLELGGLVLIGFGLSRSRGTAGGLVEGTLRDVSGTRPIRLRAVPVSRLSVRQEARLTGRSKSAVHRTRQKAQA